VAEGEAKPAGEVKYRVRILDRREFTAVDEQGRFVPVVSVLYATATLPPGIVTIPKERWSPEEEKRVIREDIERRLKGVGEVVEV